MKLQQINLLCNVTKYINIAERIREGWGAGGVVNESLFFLDATLLKNYAHEAGRIEPTFVYLNFKD